MRKICFILIILLSLTNVFAQSQGDDAVSRGKDFGRKGMYDKSIAEFNKAIKLSPANAEAYNGRAVSNLNKGNLDQAIADCSRAIKIDPNYAKAYYNRGLACFKKGEFKKAVSDQNKAIEINPKYADAFNGRAVAYFFLQDYSRSWSDVKKAEALGYIVNPEFLRELKSASGKS